MYRFPYKHSWFYSVTVMQFNTNHTTNLYTTRSSSATYNIHCNTSEPVHIYLWKAAKICWRKYWILKKVRERKRENMYHGSEGYWNSIMKLRRTFGANIESGNIQLYCYDFLALGIIWSGGPIWIGFYFRVSGFTTTTTTSPAVVPVNFYARVFFLLILRGDGNPGHVMPLVVLVVLAIYGFLAGISARTLTGPRGRFCILEVKFNPS